MKPFALALLCLIPGPAFAAADPMCVAYIKGVYMASMKAGPFIVETDQVWEPGGGHTVSEYDPPNAFHSLAKREDGTPTEIWVVDGKAWMKFKDNLTESPGLAEAYLKPMQGGDPFPPELTFSAADCVAGEVNLFGITLRKVTYSIEASGTVIENELYIDTKTGLPSRTVSSSIQMEKQSVSTSTYQYGVTVNIKAPTP